MKKSVMRRYAKLIAKCGVNVQKGQEVEILTQFDQPEFIRMLVEECYKLGAKKVIVDWTSFSCCDLMLNWYVMQSVHEAALRLHVVI